MAVQSFLTILPNTENSVYFGDGPPAATDTAAYKAGDIIICNSSDGNDPIVWRCTTAGTPGTWNSVGESLRQLDFTVAGGTTQADYGGGFIMRGAWQLVAAVERHEVAGSDGSAVTLMVTKVASGTAIGSGTAMLAAGFNMKATADTNQSATVHATLANTQVADGNLVGLVLTGTGTAVDGVTVSTWWKKL